MAMSDLGAGSVPPPAWEVEDAPPERRRHVQREAAFQTVVIAFLHRVLLHPYEFRAIAQENEMTDNARARARQRGVKSGTLDLYLAQYPRRSIWIELKWGGGRVSDAQEAFAREMHRCEIPAGFAWSVPEVLLLLQGVGFNLHGNCVNIAEEYQARALAAVRNAEIKAGKPPKVGKARKERVSTSKMGKVWRKRMGLLPR
jgi:hypothetical protein